MLYKRISTTIPVTDETDTIQFSLSSDNVLQILFANDRDDGKKGVESKTVFECSSTDLAEFLKKSSYPSCDTKTQVQVKLYGDSKDALQRSSSPHNHMKYRTLSAALNSFQYYGSGLISTPLELNFSTVTLTTQQTYRRMLSLNQEEIVNAIMMDDGYTEKHPEIDGGGAIFLNEPKTNAIIKALKLEITALNKGTSIPEKYINLATTYTLISTNLPLDQPDAIKEKSLRIAASIAMLHTVHWIIADLIDHQRDYVDSVNYGKYAELIIDTFLAPMQKPTLSPEELEAKYTENYTELSKLTKGDDMRVKTEKKCRMATQGLTDAWANFQSQMDTKYLTRFEEGFKLAVEAFKDKMNLIQTQSVSVNDYLNNRLQTSGCRPYMSAKYYLRCMESGIDLEAFHTFITNKDNTKRIVNFEREIDEIIGMINDCLGTIKDAEEGGANGVFIFSDLEYTPRPVHDAKKIHKGLEQTRKWTREKFGIAYQQISMLNSDVKESERKFVNVIAQVLLQEMYAIAVFSFYEGCEGRYEKDTPIVRYFTKDADFLKKNPDTTFEAIYAEQYAQLTHSR